MRLSQSNVILFCLLFAFLVFITLRGELPRYLAVIFTTVQSGSGSGSGGSGGADAAPSAAQAASDPIGALAGTARRALGVGNSLLPNIGSLLGM